MSVTRCETKSNLRVYVLHIKRAPVLLKSYHSQLWTNMDTALLCFFVLVALHAACACTREDDVMSCGNDDLTDIMVINFEGIRVLK